MNLVQTLEQWRSEDLKKYVYLLNGASSITRKADRVAHIACALLNPGSLQFVWQQMDGVSQRAVSVAYHNGGEFNSKAFVAQYGGLPPRSKPKDGRRSYYYHKEPILFDLFVIGGRIADDLMPLLADLALPPERFQLEGSADTPTQVEMRQGTDAVIVAETEAIGRADLLAYLQLMEQKQLRFSAKSQRLTAASVRKVLANLATKDFRESSETATGRTTIRPTGLDVFTQESGLATRTGKLTKAGRTYLQTQDPETLLDAFDKWATSGKFDELHRIANLGGLKSRGTRLTPAASRREQVIEALSWCPTERWIDIGDFYRALSIWDFDFEVEKSDYSRLYIGSRYYGDLNSVGNHWELTSGLYINVVIWEILATIGAVDIAFLEDDFLSLVSTDYLHLDEPVSLYDGLSHFRINAWGAYLLGQADEYVPAQPAPQMLFTIDAEKRVHLTAALSPAERLQLEAMTEPIDPQRYQLDEMKLLSAVENGQPLDTLIDFLRNGHRGELPRDILDWLFTLRQKQGVFKEAGTATLIQLKQADTMAIVQGDKVLSKLCRPLDERTLLVRSPHLTRFRKRLKTLGYLLG